MSDFGQYAVGLLIIGAIAIVDNFIVVESRVDPTPNDMIWIGQSDFTADDLANDLVASNNSTPNEAPGFWIDTAFVSKAEYQEFVTETGYQGSHDIKPMEMLAHHTQPMHANTVYALQMSRGNAAEDSAQYVSKNDALAFCHWLGMELSTSTQNKIAARIKHQALDSSVNSSTTARLANIDGFRCVKLVN